MTDGTDRRRGPSWKLSLAIIVAGVALAVPFVVRAVGSVAGSVTAPAHRTPVTLQENLDRGRYVIFERTGTTRQAGPFSATDDRPPMLEPSAVRVTGPDGSPITTSFDEANETITQGSAIFTGVVVFDVTEEGRHQIEVAGDGRQVLLAPSLGQTFRRLGRPLLAAGGGGLVALVGVVLLVVGIVRRGRDVPSAASAGAPGPPSAGWYADPGGSGRLRYWDGDRWTDHLSS